MAASSFPFSAVTKLKDEDKNDDGEPKKKTREEWKKAKELEEARKAGTVPAAVDEEGKDINPHIPQYIATAPWYFGALGPTLKHQRPQPEKQQEYNVLSEHYIRGEKGKQVTKYRKGACENCGAVGHTKKDCFERPRKVGAKYHSVNISADDIMLPKLSLDYDGKRDRWNGFNPSEYKAVVEEHQKVEDFKRQLKAQKLKEGQDMNGSDSNDGDDDDDEDDEKYAENIDMPGTKVDSKQRITVRNLRIREDTAKYLRNLNPNSAYYDPKTRSMRDNPYKNTGKTEEEVDYAGENFVKFTGDTVEQAKAQLFAWEAYEKGVDVSLQAEPTKLEILKMEFSKKKDEFKEKVSSDLLDKYGGKEHLDVPPRELLLEQSENYVEYSRRGKIIKGAEKEVRSKYEEDIHPGNHVSVWGSYWRNGKWGYKCCHSFVKNSYCTGEAGKSVTMVAISSTTPSIVTPTSGEMSEGVVDGREIEADEDKSLLDLHQEKLERKLSKKKKKNKKKKLKILEAKKKENSAGSSDSGSPSSDSESDSEESREAKRRMKLRQALIKAKLEEDQGRALLETDERKRGYNTMYEHKQLTEEEIEAYQIRRMRPEDPMAFFMN